MTPADQRPGTRCEPDTGDLLAGRYALESVLGRGGMADVHRALDRLLDRQVAVKLLRESADSDSDRQRFTAEARTLAQLSHTGLVMVLDAGITEQAERPYLVMELVEGPTLAHEIERGPVGPERVRGIGVQLAEALAYVHDSGVVHRDVKPGNVLLGPDRVKLADFGIARLIGDTVRHTRTGQAIGTAAYLAPEQVTGRDIDGRADIYSLGLVLLEALTGARAFPGSPTEAAVARLSRSPDIPSTLPADLRRLLTRMTDLEPERRPSAAEVAAELRAQPTGAIPVAEVRDLTRPLTEARTAVVPTVPAPSGPPPSGPPPSGPPPSGPPASVPPPTARWSGSSLLDRVRHLEPHQVGVLAVAGSLLLLMLVVALVAGSGGASDELPPNTPSELREPLADLHDAVGG